MQKVLQLFLLLSLLLLGCTQPQVAISDNVPPTPTQQTQTTTPAKQTEAKKFSELPKEIQAVVVSLEYQLGPGGAKKYVDLIVAGKYEAAALALESATTYTSRRKEEARLLREGMKKLDKP